MVALDLGNSLCYDITMTTANENDGKYVDYLNFPPSSWKRPEGPPRVWRVVDGRRKMPDGKIPRFSLQEVPKALENDVVEFMVTYFTTEEPACVDQCMSANSLAVREVRTFWRNMVRQGVSIVALQVNTNPTEKPVIAGVNVLGITTKEDDAISKNAMDSGALKYRSMLRKIFNILSKLAEDADVFGKYGVDRYLSAFGLSVHPSLRGQGLGEEILRSRDDIGLAYQIPVSETIFTGTASQILAARVGFEVLLERKYSELLDDEGKVAYPSITVEFMKVMAKRLY